MLYKVKQKSEIKLDCFIILWSLLYMENNLTPKGDNDNDAIAFGDFTYDEVGKFMSVYLSATRAMRLAFNEGGLQAALNVQARLMKSVTEVCHNEKITSGENDKVLLRASAVAISCAFSSAITLSDPINLAEFSNKSLEAAYQVFTEKPDVYESSHIIFEASEGNNGIAIKVYAIAFEDGIKEAHSKLNKIININNKIVGNN